ncbi:MAG: hypothetical protein AAF288_04490 [Planctomycetota bacterium]
MADAPDPPMDDDAPEGSEGDASSPNLDGCLLIVVGSDLDAERFDRRLAYALQKRIEAWRAEHAEVLDVAIEPVVCTDLWYLTRESAHRRPSVCLGSPEVNVLSRRLASRLPEEVQQDTDEPRVLLQVDEDFTDLRVCLWGSDGELTAKGLDIFCERYLDDFLRAVATQVEPQED